MSAAVLSFGQVLRCLCGKVESNIKKLYKDHLPESMVDQGEEKCDEPPKPQSNAKPAMRPKHTFTQRPEQE
jgi:hypothetical protein